MDFIYQFTIFTTQRRDGCAEYDFYCNPHGLFKIYIRSCEEYETLDERSDTDKQSLQEVPNGYNNGSMAPAIVTLKQESENAVLIGLNIV